MTILRPDSRLRRLPQGLDHRQTLFLDGMRHAIEIADLAYQRLVHELAELARSERRVDDLGVRIVSAFLHAWAAVDAIDRLRGLFHLLPGRQDAQEAEGQPGFRERTQGIRDLRNVSDHLANLVDHVAAHQGAALGKLTWLSVIRTDPPLVRSCTIVPGTHSKGRSLVVHPAGMKRIALPSDCVTLTAGQYSASLSEAMEEVRRIARELERSLDHAVAEYGLREHKGSDLLVVLTMVPNTREPETDTTKSSNP